MGQGRDLGSDTVGRGAVDSGTMLMGRGAIGLLKGGIICVEAVEQGGSGTGRQWNREAVEQGGSGTGRQWNRGKWNKEAVELRSW